MVPTYSNNHFFIDLFEKRLCEFTGAPYAVLTDSCTNAIFLSLYYLKNWSDLSTKHLTVPRQTYISVPQAVRNAGFDVQYDDVMWEGMYYLEDSPVVDAAVGFCENMYREGDMMCLSFQQKKPLSIGKGGAIILDNYEAYQVLKRLAWDGRDASVTVQEDLDNIIHGFHMNMIPDDAAKGILKLNNFSGGRVGTYNDYPDISTVGMKW